MTGRLPWRKPTLEELARSMPPCEADAGVSDEELLVGLAEAVHMHHPGQPEDWRLCEFMACRRAQQATRQEP